MKFNLYQESHEVNTCELTAEFWNTELGRHRNWNLIILICFFQINLISFGQKKAVWKGEIEYKNGVKVVVNPKEPMFGEIELELIKDLSIGKTDDENFLFYKVSGIEVDKNGNIYVLDSGNHRVQKYDLNGNYLVSIGKKGLGPGEFNNPINIQIDDEAGYVFVNDYFRKVLAFNQEGKYLDEDIIPNEALIDFYVDADRNILGKYSTPRYRGLVIIENGETVGKKIVEFPFQVNIKKYGSSKVGSKTFTRAVGGTHGYEFNLFLSRIDKQMFVYGYSKEYELPIINSEGKHLLISGDHLYRVIRNKDELNEVIKYRIGYSVNNFIIFDLTM